MMRGAHGLTLSGYRLNKSYYAVVGFQGASSLS